jgi:alpha-galactosidase
MSRARDWFESAFGPPSEGPFPVTFGLGGADPHLVMSRWAVDIDERDETRVLTLTDAISGLRCRCEARLFDDFPAVEWVAYIANTSAHDSPIIESIHALDWVFEAAKDTPCELHHSKGSQCRIDDFAPVTTPLPVGSEAGLASEGGRSSNGVLPFWNLAMGDQGIIGAVGWTGDWSAQFNRHADSEVHIAAGMQRTHLRLRPGEEIRTPRMLLFFWEGDITEAHNAFRRFILAHHTPRPNGKLVQTPISTASWGEERADEQIAMARLWKDSDIPMDHFWIDAGWYGDAPFREDATVFNSPWGSQVGNWFPNREAYPDGLKPVGDALKEMGFKFLLWIESERAYKGTRIVTEHPEWFLTIEKDGERHPSQLFNLGIPEARQYLTDLISSIISKAGLSVYRQDFNMNPGPYWQAADAQDRVGMSEIRHIEGLYAMWDELLERHPGLVIDNCASGGRRIDLETISRSIPLWRSDFQCHPSFDPIGIQGQTQGLGKWVPLSTGCIDRHDTYAFRSALGPGITCLIQFAGSTCAETFPAEWLREMMQEQIEVAKYFYGDFYPLVSFSLSDDTWAAWQFNRPDLGEGMVLALRRQRSPFTSIDAPLRGLDPGAEYEISSKDTGTTIRLSGRELAEEGLPIEINEKPGSALFVYRKADREEEQC